MRFRIRAEKHGDTGNAFEAGVYNMETAAYPLRKLFPAADMSGDYRWYVLGTFVPRRGDMVYLAPQDNMANISAIYTDRIELVPVQKEASPGH